MLSDESEASFKIWKIGSSQDAAAAFQEHGLSDVIAGNRIKESANKGKHLVKNLIVCNANLSSHGTSCV